jgi:hypothetical protein
MTALAHFMHQRLSGEAALEVTDEIAGFYRTPGSAGYHAATNLTAQHLRDAGFGDLEVTTYPIDGETIVMGETMPWSWEPYGAVVRIVTPVQEELVGFQDAQTCLCVWSRPTPEGGLTAEVVDVGTGEAEADWSGREVEGKIAFIHNTDRREAWKHAAAEALRRGAAGVLTDYLLYPLPPHRTRDALPDAVQFLRLPNSHNRYDAWGCSISGRAGDRLRELLKLGPVQVRADVKCRSFKGYGQNLVATIPGREREDESVIMMAHTTGTHPGANCAAGVALLIGIAGALKTCIETGELPRPRRSIRFMVVVEGLGTQVWISEHQDELHKIKAAICLDSVGNHQDKLKSTLMYSRHPDSSPSFINDYFEGLIERTPQDANWIGRKDDGMSPVVFTSEPYTPWSDNNRWASMGIPSPLIMSTPSIHFHTQFLTADTMDPAVFRRAGVPAAVALYEIANAGVDEALWMAEGVATRSIARVRQVVVNAEQEMLAKTRPVNTPEHTKSIALQAARKLDYVANRDARAIASTASLMPEPVPSEAKQRLAEYIADLHNAAQQGGARMVRQLELAPEGAGVGMNPKLDSVPVKVQPGFTPGIGIVPYADQARIAGEMQAEDPRFLFYALRVMNDELWNSIDGQRTCAEIAAAVCMEFELDLAPSLFLPLIEVLVDEGLVKLKTVER